MARRIIDIGTIGNDGTGDSIRDSFRKVNDNFRELYSSLGLGERLTFIGLDDTPNTYVSQNDPITGATPLVTVNNDESGLTFKQLVEGNGISIDFASNPNEIVINADFAEISADTTPQLGGNLSAKSGSNQYRILDLGTTSSPLQPIFKHEAVNKAYADSKVSLQGVNAIDPETGNVNSAFGRMGGPLILARDPEPGDDETYDGLIAATKRYVDNAAFGSVSNLYVALSGQDDRTGVARSLQGRALAYAYRTIEAALKRAEELILEAPLDIGPYRKTLTFNQGADECALTDIIAAPDSGSGFQGVLSMSIDTAVLDITSPGTNYFVGDILEIAGGTPSVGGGRATLEVLSAASTPGQIVTFRVLSSGSYSVLPGSTNISVTVIDSAAPPGILVSGTGARFNLTYRVNSVRIKTIAQDGVDGRGAGYSLVSVRVTGGGGTGAFGTAVVVDGKIESITITDRGSGFTSLPTLTVNLPRFLISTGGLRTDFTGDVLTNTPEAIRGRDIREGLFLKGNTSGALAQILSHSGELDTDGNEIFDVDIKFGNFEIGEAISYGDVSKNIQISILVESGEYYENYPLKIPQNTSIVGDEFRRVIIRPKPGTSSSPWAFQRFRRDLVIDGLTVADREYGYHYLSDTSRPVYVDPLTNLPIANKGSYDSAAALLLLNRDFLQNEIIAWMNNNIANASSSSIWYNFPYNESLCKRDVGLLVDSFVFDLKWGGSNRTVSAGLKYYESQSGLIAITTQETQYLAVLDHLDDLMQSIIDNVRYTPAIQNIYLQIVDPAFQAEPGSDAVVTLLVNAIKEIITSSGVVNFPKDNDQMDVFLANDAVRWQAITCQGHGGFMGVLDPEGQILAKSPYFQECASFSKSIDRQTFAGGMFVDGFAGNLQFNIDTVVTPTRIEVSGLDRFPQLPCSFIVQGGVYRVNYVRDFVYDPAGSTATLILDESTPWPFAVFTYDSAACSRDTGLIIDGLGYDIVFGTNYNTRQSGLTYRLAQSSVVINEQRQITINAIEYAHELAKDAVPGLITIQQSIDLSSSTIVDIIDRGVSGAPTLTFTLPPGLSTNLTNAYTLLLANRNYIVAEVNGWIKAQIAGNIAPWTTSDTYNEPQSQRDTRNIIEAVIYDLIYGGNTATRTQALKFYNNLTGVPVYNASQSTKNASAITYAKDLTKLVIRNLAPGVSYSSLVRVTGTGASATEAATVETLMAAVANALSVNNFTTAQSSIVEIVPNIGAYAYNATAVSARASIVAAKSSIQSNVIAFVDETGNRYELLMPGNRSMLANDYTQINDLGYGAIAMNGGLIELVSMFTYYCHISYYSVTGGQIRSVGGSSAHGNYALVAEGADPLEVPTPTTVFEDFSQRVDCYFPNSIYANTVGGLFIFVHRYDYVPLANSELEIDHGNIIYRYPVVSVTTTDLPTGVARLNLSSGVGSTAEGLFLQVPDNTKMTLRSNGQVLLTGSLEDVAVRPSTGLKLRESGDTVYRVLQFSAFTDPNGPYEVSISQASPAVFRLLETVTTISSNVCTTSRNHKLKLGDVFIPTSSGNGLTSGTVYYIVAVPNYNQFKVALSPGGTEVTLTNGSGLSIKGARTHKLLENYTISFSTTGSLPSPLLAGETYYVSADGLTETEFSVSLQRFGVEVNTTSAGSGVHSFSMVGLTRTNLRENYNYIDLTLWQPGEFVTTGSVCTINIASPATITLSGHSFTAGNVVKFTTTGALPGGLSTNINYFVLSAGLVAGTSFRVSAVPGGPAVETVGTQSGTHRVGLVTGRAGDSTFAVVPIASQEISRVNGSKFVFKGEEYIVSNYEPETVTNQPYARITLDRPLVDSIIQFGTAYTIKSAVPIRSSGSLGTLTIRIALTRVTSHDLLEIGTGSYADTNYPKEIYGASVNPVDESQETEERDVGRVFYVTTDQFGNFKVGPYFKVDQGTGTVTFSSSIALSNLDGIGFKRGVPVSEFSTDSGFTDNATDTVPTENATRVYIERRLGLSHDGAPVVETQLIPPTIGGFMSLDGQLGMKGAMNLNNNKIVNLSDATNPQDAVNLRSLTWANFQNFSASNIEAADLLVFTGSGNSSVNGTVIGDITFSLRPGVDSTLNQIDAQINPGVILNADINATADIAQSKLLLNLANTRAAAPTGTAAAKQAASGVASFDSAVFDVIDGFVTIKNNGVVLSDLPQLSTRTVLGNSTLGTANVSEVAFSTVVNDGGAIKKSQYSGTGFLRRTSSVSFNSDGDYSIVEAAAGSAASPEPSRLIVRDSNGDFGARVADLSQLKIDNNVAIDSTATATGGFLRYTGWNSAGSVTISSGSLATDRISFYDNDAHQFRTQNGLSLAPITASSITATALTTGANTTAGTITGRWTLTGTSPNESRLQATYSADLAEYYEGDKEYEVGTVLIFGGDKEVTISNKNQDTRVAGVVSNTAAFVMYDACPGHKNLVALQGRVPCRVVGKIQKGDLLVTSNIPGVAVSAGSNAAVGTVVGKALQKYESDHIGTIEIAVGRT